MNWYNRHKVYKLSECRAIFGFSEPKGLIKTAGILQGDITEEDHSVPDNQRGVFATFFDVQQYVMDSYMTKIGISECADKWTVTLLCNHSFLGTIAYDAYWTFGKDEQKEAESTYDAILKEVKAICERFVEERITTAIYWPTLKSELQKIDPDHRVATNIPWINYARNLEIEPDWRKNIYGNRYPEYSESNYLQRARYMASLWPR